MKVESDSDVSQERLQVLPISQSPRRKKKIGFWQKIGGGSLAIAVLIHVNILIIAAFIIFRHTQPAEKSVNFLPSGGGGGTGGDPGIDYPMKQKLKARLTPTSKVRRVFAAGAPSALTFPEEFESLSELSMLETVPSGGLTSAFRGIGGGLGRGSGRGSGFGKGFGFGGDGSGKLFAIPDLMRKRCSGADRSTRLAENGGTPECEDAVLKGIRWLKANQNPDGSWSDKYPVAMTGLALLAYFGHCETPTSAEFGDSCVNGIAYLVNKALLNGGRMGTNYSDDSWCYEHAIATYALAEAATFCRELAFEIPYLMEMTTEAGQFIIDNQDAEGGWDYAYDRYSRAIDISISGWQIQALKACDHSGLKFVGMQECVDKALIAFFKCENERGSFGYRELYGPRDNPALTGVATLCNQMWGYGDRPGIQKAVGFLKKNTVFDYDSANFDLYGHYYLSQAMMQRGHEEWGSYNALFRDQLLKNQNEDGCWKSPGGSGDFFRGEQQMAKVYRTAICTLMLEVYYRFLSTDNDAQAASKKPDI